MPHCHTATSFDDKTNILAVFRVTETDEQNLTEHLTLFLYVTDLSDAKDLTGVQNESQSYKNCHCRFLAPEYSTNRLVRTIGAEEEQKRILQIIKK